MQVIERTQEHYDVQDVEFGRVYRWRPKNVVVECDCGQRLALTASETTCGECGADHAAVVRSPSEARRVGDDEILHPWRYSRDREDFGIPF